MNIDFHSILKSGIPLSEFNFKQMNFKLPDSYPNCADNNLPVSRDFYWQDMLRRVIGYVPEGAEHAPLCHCELLPIVEKYEFSGLAGLPPAVRLMDGFFPVRDQSKRGSCFAFALVALCEYMLGKTVELSEQSLFHFTKLVTPGKVEDLDDGAIILDSIHAVEEYGICPLSEWHYNPESWNYVEDPHNEGQGKALQRKLAAAQPYRFRNWRTLSKGSVLQFKQALSAGFPIYTGVLVTKDWDNEDVHKTGIIPFPKIFWHLRVLPPPRGLVAEYMAEKGIDPEAEEAEVIKNQIAAMLIQDTIEYIGSAVFGCSLLICNAKEEADFYEFEVILDKICGGHALCFAGYVDDDSYPGGGYFIARNSWSDDKWAPDSPEMPGYALLPYAYIADLGGEGIVMSEFPADMKIPSAAVAVPASESTGFEAWLAARKSVLSEDTNDELEDLILWKGTPILIPDLANPNKFVRDTSENRVKLRAEYEREIKEAKEASAKLRAEQKARAAEERETRFGRSLRETIDEVFAADEYAVMSLAALKDKLLANDPDLAEINELGRRIRAFVIELQRGDPRRYWFGRGFGGVEELRPSGKDSDRIKA